MDTKVQAQFSGQFKQIKNVGDIVQDQEILGQIYHGGIWQNQHTSVGGRIDSILSNGVQVAVGDIISEIGNLFVYESLNSASSDGFTSKRVKKSPSKKVSSKKRIPTTKKGNVKKKLKLNDDKTVNKNPFKKSSSISKPSSTNKKVLKKASTVNNKKSRTKSTNKNV